jgi:hypothetical protein
MLISRYTKVNKLFRMFDVAAFRLEIRSINQKDKKYM